MAEKADGSGGASCLLSRCFATCGEDTAGCLVRRMQRVKPPEGYVGSGIGGFMSAGKERGGGEKRVLYASEHQPPARPRLRLRKRRSFVTNLSGRTTMTRPQHFPNRAATLRDSNGTTLRHLLGSSAIRVGQLSGPQAGPLEMGARLP